jgi:F-type H+-transporting ATPase subunit delta
MFSAESWARAFIQAFPNAEGAEDAGQLEAALESLRAYCHAGLLIPGELSGLNDAARAARLVDTALEKAGMDADTAALYARRFFLLMVRKGSFGHYKKIVTRIKKLINEKKGLVEAALETPFEADEGFLEQVRQYLLEKTKAREIKIKARTVPELIGGLRFRIGSVLFDGSLKTRLEKMAANLSVPPF